MESHLSRPPLPSLQGNRTWSFQRLAWTRGAPGALPWTTDRDVGAACIHNSLYVHKSSSRCWMRSTDAEQHWRTMNPTGSSHTAARSSQRSSARSPKTQPCACQTGQWMQALPTLITVWRSTGNARSTTTRWSATLEQLSTTWTQPSTSNSIVGVLSPRKSRNTCKNGTSSQSTLIFGAHTYERRQWCGVCAGVREESLYEEMPSDDKENIMTIH